MAQTRTVLAMGTGGEPFGRQLTGLTVNWVDELYGVEERRNLG